MQLISLPDDISARVGKQASVSRSGPMELLRAASQGVGCVCVCVRGGQRGREGTQAKTYLTPGGREKRVGRNFRLDTPPSPKNDTRAMNLKKKKNSAGRGTVRGSAHPLPTPQAAGVKGVAKELTVTQDTFAKPSKVVCVPSGCLRGGRGRRRKKA